jgi:ribonuclease HII
MIEKPLELDLWNDDKVILGMDEAGRGPIAGPLMVAGVIFPKGYTNTEIDDSKKLSEKKREKLYDQIIHDAFYYQILIVDEKTIDQKNIYRATQEAMNEIARKAPCDYVLSDAMPLIDIGKPFEAIIKGDQKSLSIAAASILAKVTRDRWMIELDAKYPQYGLAKHKGYPTKAHIEALNKYGLQDFYRRSYGPVKKLEEITLF